jgi:hypothetical protein
MQSRKAPEEIQAGLNESSDVPEIKISVYWSNLPWLGRLTLFFLCVLRVLCGESGSWLQNLIFLNLRVCSVSATSVGRRSMLLAP